MDKQNIIEQCRKAGTCKREFDLLVSARTDEEFLSVIGRNIHWCNLHIQLPTDVLSALSKDDHWGVRCGVAQNINTPTDVLSALSKDDHWGVRHGVVKNPNTPTAVLITLSEDSDWGVRYGVVFHPNTPKDVLITLSEDENMAIRLLAKERL
jgi:pentose-5-phosphate-3-epimerase